MAFLSNAPRCPAKERSPEERLVSKYCTSCHVTPKVGRFTEETINASIDKHSRKLRNLTPEDRITIVNYLKKQN